MAPVAGAEAIRPHVTSDRDDVARLLDVLLSGAVRVAGIDEAIAIATANPTAVVVTADGRPLRPPPAGASARRRRAAPRPLRSTRPRAGHGDAERALAACGLEVDRCADRVVSAERHETELSARLDENDRRFTAATEALARSQAELREIHAEVEPLQQRIAELAEQVAGERARIAELDALVPDLEAGASAEEAAARARTEVRASIDTRAALLVGRRRDLELRAAGRHERRELLTGRLAEAERRLAADAAERTTAEHRRTQVERSLQALERLAEFVGERRTAVAAYRDRLEPVGGRRARRSPRWRRVSTIDAGGAVRPSASSTRFASGPAGASSTRPRPGCGWSRPSRCSATTSTSSPTPPRPLRRRSCPTACRPRRASASSSARCVCSVRSTRWRSRSSASCSSVTRSSRNSSTTCARHGAS